MRRAPGIVVHGGAGSVAPERFEAAAKGCERAVAEGLRVLSAGGSALDAAQTSVRILEDDPQFNAGIGAVLTRDATLEMDAALMDGATLRFGAVAALPNAPRAIDVARAVLDDGEQVLLCGEGAWLFAREHGFEPGDPAALTTDRARARLAQAAQDRRDGWQPEVDPGTVGAVAFDANGHVAAATSTGGTTYKRRGRIGDTPLCGCGTYADDAGGAASATGHGESLIRATSALHCVNAMRAGSEAFDASRACIAALGDRVGGEGGIICVDRDGRLGASHNSAHMAHAAGRVGVTRVMSGVVVSPDERWIRL